MEKRDIYDKFLRIYAKCIGNTPNFNRVAGYKKIERVANPVVRVT